MVDPDVDLVDESQSPESSDGAEEPLDFVSKGGSAEDDRFDEIVGALEGIIMDPSFDEPLRTFCKQHCHNFEDSEENRLEYTDLHFKYNDLVEGIIEKRLKEQVPNFSMEEFLSLLSKQANLDGEVFDLLLTLTDFHAFKDLMLSYKHEQDGLLQGLSLSVQKMRICTDEQEDGEQRPDLDTQLQISPLRKQNIAS